jgi:hypothetical protein
MFLCSTKRLFLRHDVTPVSHRAQLWSGMAARHREAAPQASLTKASVTQIACMRTTAGWRQVRGGGPQTTPKKLEKCA